MHLGHRQGAARGHHRRRAARGRSHEAPGIRAADRLVRLARHQRRGVDGDAVGGPRHALQTLRNLSQSDILLSGLPSLYYRLLKTDSNTRTLANPQLRTTDGIAATARFGEQVPVPVTTFAPIATGGTPQQPITSFNYQNIGVNIDITPRTHHDDDVTLALKIAVTSISGTGFGGLPTFGNREINTIIRLRDGETNMLAGLIRDDERHSLDGIPGLSDLPLVGRLFAHTTKTADSDRHHPDADAAHHPRAGPDRSRSAAVPRRPRLARADHRTAAADRTAEAAGAAQGKREPPRAEETRRRRGRCLKARSGGFCYDIFATFAPSPCSRSTSRP